MQIRSSKSEAGFALILAIIALMLLTFLGLTLSLSTSTETQVARNYSWSRQAHYNALAGAEVARNILTTALLNGTVVDWSPYLPATRVAGSMSAPPATGSNSNRDWEGAYCDKPVTEYGRNGVGYGRIMTLDGSSTGTQLQDVTTYQGQNLKGAFTVWVRRVTKWDGSTNQMVDDTAQNSRAVITVEGVAPYIFTASNQSGATQRQQQAVQVIEIDIQATTNNKGRNTDASNEATGANRSLATNAVVTNACANGTGGTAHADTMGTNQ
jgi:hypothetical protein